MKSIPPLPNYHQLQENGAREFSLINRLIQHLAQPPFCQSPSAQNKDLLGEKSKSCGGIGDDCAVIPSSIVGKYLVASVDAFIEGRHFLFNISSPEQIGYKAVATAASDIAAMGGELKFILLNLLLPSQFEQAIVERIYGGISEFCAQFGAFVIGGNTSSASEFSVSTTVIGECNVDPLFRSGAKVGDDFWVSGVLGLSHLGLLLLKDGRKFEVAKNVLDLAISRYQRPEPRILLGQKLLDLGATSAIDISDGIFQDAGHIALQSGVEIELDLNSLNQVGLPEKEHVELLSGGGDYEIFFSAPPELRTSIASLNTELDGNSQLVRCGTATRADSLGSLTVATTQGRFKGLELQKKFNLISLGNDHFAKI